MNIYMAHSYLFHKVISQTFLETEEDEEMRCISLWNHSERPDLQER